MTDQLCSVASCDQPATARGWCWRHYKIARRNNWRVPEPAPQVGSPSGHGLYGILDDDGTSVLCHECGRRFRALGYHLLRAHEMTAEEYRATHGLRRGLGLIAGDLHQLRSEHAKAHIGSQGWQRLEAARDPLAASRARPPEALRTAPGAMPRKAQIATTNLPRKQPQERTCPVCDARYRGRGRTCGNPQCVSQARADGAKHQAQARPQLSEEEQHELQHSEQEQLRTLVYQLMLRGISSREIGQALGHGGQWMTKNFPRPQ